MKLERHHDLCFDIVRNDYRRTRDTGNLLIDKHVFAGTVKRFRRDIATSKLRYVSDDDAEAGAVCKGMTRCSNRTHEGGAEAPPALSEPAEFIADVEALVTALRMIDNKKKAMEKRHKEAGQATAACRLPSRPHPWPRSTESSGRCWRQLPRGPQWRRAHARP